MTRQRLFVRVLCRLDAQLRLLYRELSACAPEPFPSRNWRMTATIFPKAATRANTFHSSSRLTDSHSLHATAEFSPRFRHLGGELFL